MPLTNPPIGSAPLYARNKLTGETFLVGPTTKMIDDLGDVDTSTTGPTGGNALIWDDSVSQWVPGVASTVAGIDDLTDVDTTTTAPADGDGLVWDETTGQWTPGPGGLQISTDADNEVMLGTDGGLFSNEVHLGPTGPTLSGPDLWANPDEGLLFAAATGPTGAVEWVPVGGSEVEVGDVEPTSEWEVWVDTSTQSPLPGAPVGLALDDLTDVVSAAPVDGNGLGWDSAASNWVPQGMWKSWSGTQAEFDAIPTKDPNTLYAVI
jgi:trimeric autotransporter adhesin